MSTEDPSIRILVADRAPEIRQALRLVCEEHLKHCVVTETATDDELLKQARISQPDIILLEWELSATSPSKLIHQLKGAVEKAYIIVLSHRSEIRTEALHEDVYGFVYKGDSPDILIRLLHQLVE